jgi:hypothetical protein
VFQFVFLVMTSFVYFDVEMLSPARFSDYANRNAGFVDSSHVSFGEL